MPLITIVIPVYNSSIYLEHLFHSLKNIKSIENNEVIFVNDCSTDNSLALLKQFVEQNNMGVIVDLPVNGGLANARYQGFLKSTGEYLMFVDSDDYVSPNHIENVTKYCERGYDIIINSINEVYLNGRIVTTDIDKSIKDAGSCVDKKKALVDLLENKNLCSYFVTKTIKRTLLDYSIFNWRYPYEDVARMHLLFDRAQTIYRFNRPTYYYVHNKSSIVNKKTNSIFRFLALKERYQFFTNGMERYCLGPFFDSVIDIVRYNKVSNYHPYIKVIKHIYRKEKKYIQSQYIKNHMRLFMMFGPTVYHFILILLKK